MNWREIGNWTQEPEDDDPRGHWHIDDAGTHGICDVVNSKADIPASLAELRSWYGVTAVTIKGPCYGGERCF